MSPAYAPVGAHGTYLPVIDGLRALAVLVVILFHFEVPPFGGGFVGVDLFFVISGFLITRNMLDDLQHDRFSLRRFFHRRVRRLFPAAVVVILLVLLGSALLFSPEHLARVGRSALFAVVSLSNVFFWTEAGYFDTSAAFKPLLHYWSLALEDQFYLLWPLLLLFLSRRLPDVGAVLRALLVIGVLLLVATELLIPVDRAAAFYLVPFRAIEFSLGAACLLQGARRPGPLLANLGLILGAGMIGLATATFDGQTRFPGLSSLLPTLGAALVILCRDAVLARWLLANPLAVWIGLVSYSLYLVHWPVWVFHAYWRVAEIGALEKGLLLLVTTVLAALLHYGIERPLRLPAPAGSPWSSRARAGALLSGLLALAVLTSVATVASGGWPGRIDAPDVSARYPEMAAFAPARLVAEEGFETRHLIGEAGPDSLRVLVLGDSHAGHLQVAMQYLALRHDLAVEMRMHAGCPPLWGTYKLYGAAQARAREASCRAQVPAWERVMTAGEHDLVVLAGRWATLYEPDHYGPVRVRQDYLVDREAPVRSAAASRRLFRERLELTVQRIRAAGAAVMVVSQPPLLARNVQGCNRVPPWLHGETRAQRCAPGIDAVRALARLAFTDDTIRASARPGVLPVIPSDHFCEAGAAVCRTLDAGLLLYHDDNHLSAAGSLWLVRRVEAEIEALLQDLRTARGRPPGFGKIDGTR